MKTVVLDRYDRNLIADMIHDRFFDVESIRWDKDRKHLEFSYFKDYPSVQWKLVNLAKLKRQNPEKMEAEVEKLRRCF